MMIIQGQTRFNASATWCRSADLSVRDHSSVRVANVPNVRQAAVRQVEVLVRSLLSSRAAYSLKFFMYFFRN